MGASGLRWAVAAGLVLGDGGGPGRVVAVAVARDLAVARWAGGWGGRHGAASLIPSESLPRPYAATADGHVISRGGWLIVVWLFVS